MSSKRSLVYLAVLLMCLGMFWRWAQLQRGYKEFPKVLGKLSAMGALASRLDDYQKFYLRQYVDSWMHACTKQTFDDAARRTAAERYRQELKRLADFIGEQEEAGIYAAVLRPTDEPLRRLGALRAWLDEEGAGPVAWDCLDTGTPDRIGQLGDVFRAYATCARDLASQDPRNVVWGRRALAASCGEPLRVALPGEEPFPAAARAAAAPRPGAGLEGRVDRLGGGEDGDEVVRVLVARRTWKDFVVSPNGAHIAWVVKRSGRYRVVTDGAASDEWEQVWTGMDDGHVGGPAFSADSARVAYRALRDGKWFVVVDGEAGPPWDGVEQLTLSPSEGRVAYAARREREWRVVIDGKEQPHRTTYNAGIAFSPNGEHVAYVAADEAGTAVVVDGARGPTYEGILAPGPVFSPDSRRVVYVARSRGQLVLVGTGRELPVYDGLMEPGLVFSADSSRLAYVARRGGKQVVAVDGKESRGYDRVGPFTFSPDGRRDAFVALDGGTWCVAVDGKESPPYRGVVMPGPQFSPDSRHVGWGATLTDGAAVVIDGREGRTYRAIATGSPVFSPDSQRVGYVASNRNNRPVAVIDGDESAQYQQIAGNVVFSPDSRRTAYVASTRDGYTVVVDGKEEPVRQQIVSKAPLFSPDSRHLAYVAAEGGRQRVILDGAEQGAYQTVDETKLVFSPDSAHLVYVAWSAGWRLVVDGGESADQFAGFLPDAPLVFDTATRLRTIAQASRGADFVRYRVELPAEPGLRTASRR